MREIWITLPRQQPKIRAERLAEAWQLWRDGNMDLAEARDVARAIEYDLNVIAEERAREALAREERRRNGGFFSGVRQ